MAVFSLLIGATGIRVKEVFKLSVLFFISITGKTVFQTGRAHGGHLYCYCVSSVHNVEEKFASF